MNLRRLRYKQAQNNNNTNKIKQCRNFLYAPYAKMASQRKFLCCFGPCTHIVHTSIVLQQIRYQYTIPKCMWRASVLYLVWFVSMQRRLLMPSFEVHEFNSFFRIEQKHIIE